MSKIETANSLLAMAQRAVDSAVSSEEERVSILAEAKKIRERLEEIGDQPSG
jgi:hypothetical protein